MDNAIAWGIILPLATFVASGEVLYIALRKKWAVETEVASNEPTETPMDEKSLVAQSSADGIIQLNLLDHAQKSQKVSMEKDHHCSFHFLSCQVFPGVLFEIPLLVVPGQTNIKSLFISSRKFALSSVCKIATSILTI